MKKVNLFKIDKTIYHEVLNNGLNIYFIPMESKNYHISITCKVGSTHLLFKENNKIYKMKVGCAHALEHLMFKKKDNNLFEVFEKYGAVANAYTSFDNTTYEVTNQTNYKEVLKEMLNLVFNPYFTKEDLKKEKEIIKDEIRTNKLDIFATLENKINSLIYKYDEKKYLITGDEKDIDKLNIKDINILYDLFYHPENIFIVITGNFKRVESLAIIKEYFKDKVFLKYIDKTKISKTEPIKMLYKRVNLTCDINMPIISIVYKLNKEFFKKIDDFTLGLYIEAILSIKYGKTSDLYLNLSNENIINDLIDYSYTINTSNIVITFTIRSFYTDEVINQINTSIVNNSFSNIDLNRYKKVAISNYILNFDDIVKTNDLVVNDLTSGSINTNYIKSINNLNINDLNKISKLIKNDKKMELIISHQSF